ncbi:MAG TPA: antibiotic biosynthesis monooxygenase [Stellaceae bacterium]|nr:antibiotic biosynthesis monooxygenase [Stellaceae bacterium]
MSGDPTAGPVTVVVQTRVRERQEAAFGRWQATISAAVAEQPGFIEQSVMPPNPPAQADWVILQRFTSSNAAEAWLRSDRRQQLLAEGQHLLIGAHDVHLLRDASQGVVPAPVSVVIATRVKPGQEAAFQAWEQRIARAQARASGFQGYRFEPPIPRVQEDWLAILRFDSEQNLQKWLDSPERKALLRDAEPLVEEFHTRVVRTGFEQWFARSGAAGAPPAWKQNMIVLLLLYPVVFLFSLYVQTPLLMGRAGMPFWAALFIGNIASVLLLNWLVPWASGLLSWWLHPPVRNRGRRTVLGLIVLVLLYAGELLVFWQLP